MQLRKRFLYSIVIFTCLVLHAQAQSLPVAVQRQGEALIFLTQPSVTGWRVALYSLQGTMLADSRSEVTAQWQVPVNLAPGVYLCVIWLREQNEAVKRLARLEVSAARVTLQTTEEYLGEVEPPASVVWGTPEYQAAERRAQERGAAAIPLFRAATKVMPDDTASWLWLVQAIQIKSARFRNTLFAAPMTPPPPPPPPPPVRTKAAPRASARRPAAAPPMMEAVLLTPTATEKQEMLAACQKAIAVASTCADKTEAMRWLSVVQADLDLGMERLTTLEQIAQASCATNEIKAQSWYSIGVEHWQCAYQLTTRYAHPKQLEIDPFHYRKLPTPAAQQQFAQCVQSGLAALDKVVALQPNFAEAIFYQSLLYRERQKTAALPAERAEAQATAERLVKQALEVRQKR